MEVESSAASSGGLTRTNTGQLARTTSALASALEISKQDVAKVQAAMPEYSMQHLHRLLETFALEAGGDGTIDKAAFTAKLEEVVGDGNAALLAFSGAMFDVFDADKSGNIDMVEYHLSLAALCKGDAAAKNGFVFDCLDTDKSGVISFAEFYFFFKSTLAAIGRVNQAKKLGLSEENPLYTAFAMAQIEAEKKEAEQVFGAIDTDGDGNISKPEFLAALNNPSSVGSPHLTAVVKLMKLFEEEEDAEVEEATPPTVRLVLGTMTMGPATGTSHMDGQHTTMPSYCQTPPEVAMQQLQALVDCPAARVSSGPEAGKVLVDTASAYQNWCTESTLGTIFATNPELRAQVSIHSKANSGQLPHKSLSKESILYQCNGSLERLQSTSIDIYYLHGPDINTPIEETLEAIGELHAAGECHSLGRKRRNFDSVQFSAASFDYAGSCWPVAAGCVLTNWPSDCQCPPDLHVGKIKEFGLSNFPAWKVSDIYHRCKATGIVVPTGESESTPLQRASPAFDVRATRQT